ncbi:uncharacterized protein PHALS_14927 [Plasmopara halstedii]|uniref:Uncharacterized protein n=1 Tax=Plasmopara halstedii TaxID=4781 RepID=A0A0P1ATQ1_PLAHL|nr:uncharacterized protein PHALS_14927 [Plasmopara halstedii]CEG44258.1 hypothetical protein PHALS_14927 [Plasmopara halstedii]|eukprot:XP_024580627.1 hypothetical protein PHALS_14927 [Plasmopara halstedii]
MKTAVLPAHIWGETLGVYIASCLCTSKWRRAFLKLASQAKLLHLLINLSGLLATSKRPLYKST